MSPCSSPEAATETFRLTRMFPSHRPWTTMSSSPEISPTNLTLAPMTVAGTGVPGGGGGDGRSIVGGCPGVATSFLPNIDTGSSREAGQSSKRGDPVGGLSHRPGPPVRDAAVRNLCPAGPYWLEVE